MLLSLAYPGPTNHFSSTSPQLLMELYKPSPTFGEITEQNRKIGWQPKQRMHA